MDNLTLVITFSFATALDDMEQEDFANLLVSVLEQECVDGRLTLDDNDVLDFSVDIVTETED